MSSAILTSSALDAFARPERTSSPTPPRPTSSRPEQIMFDRPLGARRVEVRRDEAAIIRKLAALAKSVGEGWCYRVPVRNAHLNRTEYIEGASIKLANDLARLYGNCDVETRVADLGASWLVAARFTDHETGFSLARPVTQRKPADRLRSFDGDRTHENALQAGVSKAIRNVVVNALQSFAEFALSEAKGAVLARIAGNLESYRASVGSQLAALVAIGRVEAVIGRPAAAWLASDLAWLIAILKAIGDGVITAAEVFPAEVVVAVPVSGAEDLTAFAAAGPSDDPRSSRADQPGADQQSSAGSSPSSDPEVHPRARRRSRRVEGPDGPRLRSTRRQSRVSARRSRHEPDTASTEAEAAPCL